MSGIIFLVKEAEEGGYIARALEYAIFTEADTLEELQENIEEAIRCHFEENKNDNSA